MASEGVDMAGKIVEVVVGSGGVQFDIEDDVLRRSRFLESVLEECQKEGGDGRILLADDIPDVIRRYIEYLRNDDVEVEFHLGNSARGLPEYRILANLYVFGEKIQDVNFKNKVIEQFLKRMIMSMETGNFLAPEGRIVDIIYQGTSEGSLARRLMVDCYYTHGKEDWIEKAQEENNKQFLMDLSSVLLRDRPRLHENDPIESALRTKIYHDDPGHISDVSENSSNRNSSDSERGEPNRTTNVSQGSESDSSPLVDDSASDFDTGAFG